MRKRKVPLRKCIACQEMKPKKELIRVVRTPDEEVVIDPSGKASGRGAYICAQMECFETALKKKAFDRALKIKLGDAGYEKLKQEWEELQS
ncbi:MAG: YlxR family protein [Bacillaceae bacterium]|nr:YlxR family protein [Bacillaceae bacterium]